MKNNYVVYTTIFGDYDNLIEPNINYKGCDFICFTDQEDLKSEIWKIIYVDRIDLPPNMMNRKYKWLPHEFLSEYEYSLYIDANVVLFENPIFLMKKFLTNNLISIPSSPSRNCIYKEAEACVKHNKSKINDTFEQIISYHKNGYPINNGLSANRVIFRRHNNDKIISLMLEHWKELNKWKTKRDQLTFLYSAWRIRLDINIIKKGDCDFFKVVEHKKNKNKTIMKRILLIVYRYKVSIIDRYLYKYLYYKGVK